MESLTWTELEAILYESLVTTTALTSQDLGTTIGLIHEEWMTYLLHVGTDLMGTARFQDALYQGGIAETLQDLIMSNRTLADTAIRIEDLHAETVLGITTDIALDASLILHDITPYQRIVTAMGSLVEELLAQCRLGSRSLGYYEQSAGIDHAIAADQPMTLPRETCQACAEKAAKDFRDAAELLPIDWDKSSVGRNTLGKNGFRINKITALAYEGKSLLWAASPLVKNCDDKMNVNGNASTYDYDTNYAQKAAEALGELLTLVESGQTQYKLVDFADYSDLFYTWNKNMLPPGSTENILRDIPADAWQNSHFGMFTEFGGSILTGGKAASQPTANYVNYYGMKNGLPLDDPDSGFDPTHPWKNRDPRFYHDIVYDGVKVVEGDIKPDANRYANLYTGGTYRDDINESRTGYLLYKFIPMIANNYDMGSTYNKLYIDVPYLRLADCYLMYAEACAAFGGATASAKCSLTALDAVNKIRERAGVEGVAAKFTGNKDKFMDEVRRERAVELAFEGHRFNDLRRWLLLDKAPYNIKTSQEFVRAGKFDPKNPQNTEVSGFKEKTILTRHFTSKHWWMPLKKKDTSIYPEMFQNPGW